MFSGGGSEDITDYDEARAVFNMENAIDYNIFIMLAWASDNDSRTNMYLVAEYENSSEGGGEYKILKIPWDCNATWGNSTHPADVDMDIKLYKPERLLDANIWNVDIKAMYRCYPDEIQMLTLERWRGLRQDILSEKKLIEMLDEDFSYLHSSGAYDRNYERWNHGREYWEDEYIYEYVRNRLEFLDAYFENMYFISDVTKEAE